MDLDIVGTLKPIVARGPKYAKLAYFLYSDPQLSTKHKVYLSACILYLISPIDLIPGIIPVAGQLDDIILALTVLILQLKRIPADRKERYLEQAGLDMEQAEADLRTAKAVLGYIVRTSALRVTRGIGWVGGRTARTLSRGYARIKEMDLPGRLPRRRARIPSMEDSDNNAAAKEPKRFSRKPEIRLVWPPRKPNKEKNIE